MILKAIIRGRVQGVGFRYWVLQQAQRLDVQGYARNLPDGRVEVEAEGDEDVLNEMEQVLWKGPTLSRVDHVDATYTGEQRGYTSFKIRH